MEMSKNYVKISFAISIAFLLIFAINSLPLAASTDLDLSSTPSEILPGSSLYKYKYHVAETQTPWYHWGYNASNINFNPISSAPSTNHILWIGKARQYEALYPLIGVVAGNVICRVASGLSIYEGNNLYAFDQNNGQIVWTYSGLSGAVILDDQHMASGTTMINPSTGQFLYTIPRSINIYVPEIEMAFGTGPSAPNGGGTVIGWDYSDIENPKQAWITDGYDRNSVRCYDNGKVFFGGGIDYQINCADAITGQILWEAQCPGYINAASAGYGNLYVEGITGGTVFDQETGQELWRMPNHGRELGGFALAYDKYFVGESDIGYYALDAHTGEIVWQYKRLREVGFPQGPAAESLSSMGYNGALAVADGKVYLHALGHTAYGRMLPANWVSEDGNQWNPYPNEVFGQTGTAEFVCLDAETGKIIWKCGVDEVGPPGGPNCGQYAGSVFLPTIADGKVFVPQCTYSSHVGINRPYSDISFDKGSHDLFINYEWFPPYLYCFGKGPTQFRDIAIDKSAINFGEKVTVSGKLVDLSPPIDSISSLSTWSRGVAEGAPKVPVVLSFEGSDGNKVPFATVETDENGMFSYTWYPWEINQLSILVESAGSDAYEAPETEITAVYVQPLAADLVPILEVALIGAIVVAVALPVIIIVRRPKS